MVGRGTNGPSAGNRSLPSTLMRKTVWTSAQLRPYKNLEATVSTEQQGEPMLAFVAKDRVWIVEWVGGLATASSILLRLLGQFTEQVSNGFDPADRLFAEVDAATPPNLQSQVQPLQRVDSQVKLKIGVGRKPMAGEAVRQPLRALSAAGSSSKARSSAVISPSASGPALAGFSPLALICS